MILHGKTRWFPSRLSQPQVTPGVCTPKCCRAVKILGSGPLRRLRRGRGRDGRRPSRCRRGWIIGRIFPDFFHVFSAERFGGDSEATRTSGSTVQHCICDHFSFKNFLQVWLQKFPPPLNFRTSWLATGGDGSGNTNPPREPAGGQRCAAGSVGGWLVAGCCWV